MASEPAPKRYIYHTQGVCPPEIHFSLKSDIVSQIRFMGGGCPGNAQLVARLLEGRPVAKVLPHLQEIPCRGDTSCPDQLHRALTAARDGRLAPSPSFRLDSHNRPLHRIGLLANPQGSTARVTHLAQSLTEGSNPQNQYDALLVMGNFVGVAETDLTDQHARHLLAALEHPGVWPVLGPRDWRLAGGEGDAPARLKARTRNRLLGLPQAVSFRLGALTAIAFYGDYLQQLPGYSDYDPFALEINMVCGLTDFMRDESVFPALAAMTSQFSADIVIFAQAERWAHREIGGKHFISLGPIDSLDQAGDGSQPAWASLEIERGEVRFRPMPAEDYMP